MTFYIASKHRLRISVQSY